MPLSFSQALAALSAGNYDDAVRLLSSPDNQIIYSSRSAAYASVKKLSDAFSSYNNSLEIDPSNGALMSGLADAEIASDRSSGETSSNCEYYEEEGIQFQDVVVIGDKSSGKTSVLESVAGISLSSRGRRICTRVPLIMRLRNHRNPNPELFLEFAGKTVPTDEQHISDAISLATEEIAGKGKGISSNPITLVVKKMGVPNLTVVDLPGITRVSADGQSDPFYEQICKIIMEFITPGNNIIMNVLSAGVVDFSACDSIKMSRKVDKTGQRTLVVVTKSDKFPKGLLEKVTSKRIDIGRGYVCVRNRIGEESYGEARAEEARLFNTDPHLSKIFKFNVGIPMLVERLVKIRSEIVLRCVPQLIRKIDDELSAKVVDLNKLPKVLSCVDAMATCKQIIGSAKESLRKILLQGEFEEYPNEKQMHGTARLTEMLDDYLEELKPAQNFINGSEKFLMDEITLLVEASTIGLPNFIPKSAFRTLNEKKVNAISPVSYNFVDNFWKYVENLLLRVLIRSCEYHEKLVQPTKHAAQRLIERMKRKSIDWVKYNLEMEKFANYTCNREYSASWKKLMSMWESFEEALHQSNMFEEIDVAHLYELRDKKILHDAFDLKMRMIAYWDIAVRRMVDNMVLHLLLNTHNMVNEEMETSIMHDLLGGHDQDDDFGNRFEESPWVGEKRNELNRRIEELKGSRILAQRIKHVISGLVG
ncbi:hypothetical protein ABFS83_01G068100 [Erythranthe nasuta]